MPSPSRDNRSATTFWFDNALKQQLKLRARQLDTTVTELINRAIEVYLEKGHLLQDFEKGRLMISQDMRGELDAKNIVDGKIQEMEQGLKGLNARIESIESKLSALNFDEETVRHWIKMYVASNIQPVMHSLSNAIQRLDREAADAQNSTTESLGGEE